MSSNNNLVYDYMRLSKIFIKENDSIFSAFELFKKHNLKRILVIKEDFSVLGCISQDELKKYFKQDVNDQDILKKTKINELNIQYDSPVFIYPKMGITDAYSIMKYFNVKYLPVLDVPWEKRIIGFLWVEDILSVIKKNCFNVPVATSLQTIEKRQAYC